MGTLRDDPGDRRHDRRSCRRRRRMHGRAVERAFGWFRQVEACCTRFDPASEAMRLTGADRRARAGERASCSRRCSSRSRSPEDSGGAFDPTVGAAMEARGFNREHRTGRIVRTTPDADRPRPATATSALDPARPDHHAAPAADPRSRRRRQGPGDRPRRARAQAVRELRDRRRRRSLPRRPRPRAGALVRRHPPSARGRG